MHIHITCRRTQTRTQKQYTPHGPVFPAGLSAFSLLPRHLHTNTVCRGPGTNTRHSTFHYWALIIEGREVAGEPVEREREGGRWRSRKKEGVSETEGEIEWRDDRLFYFPLPENPFRTRARSIEDISQTSTGSLKYRQCPCSPHPPVHPFSSSAPSHHPRFLPQSNDSPPHS